MLSPGVALRLCKLCRITGWVLITIMTAGLVTALWATAQGTLTSLFNTAVHSVTGGGN